MAKQVEKVMLPFEEDGALALSSADAAKGAAEAERLVDYAHTWGITVPADFTPATKARVAYWR